MNAQYAQIWHSVTKYIVQSILFPDDTIFSYELEQ